MGDMKELLVLVRVSVAPAEGGKVPYGRGGGEVVMIEWAGLGLGVRASLEGHQWCHVFAGTARTLVFYGERRGMIRTKG